MDHIRGAQGAGPSSPTSEETPAAGKARGLGDKESTSQAEYAAASGLAVTPQQEPTVAAAGTTPQNTTFEAPMFDGRKAFATLQARAALAGVALSRLQDDRGNEVFIASKWALTKQLATLAEVEQLLVRIGGQHAG